MLPGVHIRSSIQRLDELGIRERCGDVDVFFENFRDKKTLDGTPKCYVCRDGDSVVLSIRGTADIFDALTDVLCEAVPFLNGEAHAGTHTESNDMRAIVGRQLWYRDKLISEEE